MAIGADSTYPELTDKHKLAEMCKNLNYRHKMAQYAQRASVAFHTQVSSSEMLGWTMDSANAKPSKSAEMIKAEGCFWQKA